MKKKLFISPHLIYYKADLSIYLSFALISWGINFISPYLTGNFLDLLVQGDKEAVIFLTIILVSINILSIVLGYIYQKSLSRLNTNVAFKISFALYEKLKKAYLSYYHNTDTVYLVNRINNDSNSTIGFITSNMVSLITQTSALVLGSGILYSISVPITVVTFFAIPVYITLYRLFRKKLYDTNYNFMEQRSQYFAKMTEQFTFIKFIKIHSLFTTFANRLLSSYNTLFESLLKYFKINYYFVNAYLLILCFVNAFTFIYGGMSVINGSMSIGQYTIVNVYFNIIMQALKYFLEFGKGYQEYLVSYNRLLELYHINLEENGEIRMQDIYMIKVENLTFSYLPLSTAVFCDFNTEFHKGKIYALTGGNGAGKSSFISALLGLFNDLYKGNIMYDGYDLKDIDMYDLRTRLIAVTEQEPVLLNASLHDNIFITGEEKDKDIKMYFGLFDITYLLEKRESLEEEEFVKQNLSGGEKQKISIIRTLIRDTPVMIFDEPSSALDKNSRDVFKSIISQIKLDKIIILVTHDNELTQISDQIISIN